MKATKKQVNLIKKDANENIAVPKIKKYFKSVPKNFAIEDESREKHVTPEDSTKQFHIDALKKKLQEKQGISEQCISDGKIEVDLHEDSGAYAIVPENKKLKDTCLMPTPNNNHDAIQSSNNCAGCLQLKMEVNEWKAKSIEWEEKYKSTKKNYAKLDIHDSELSLKYNDLLKMATNVNRPDTDKAAASKRDIFTPNEVKYFRSMPLDKTKDSTFVLQCLEYAYKIDPSVLCQKTLKGKAEWIEITKSGEEVKHPAKTPLTPIKVERISELFIERVSKCKDPTTYGERMAPAYLNKLFASGIKNISKKHN